MFEYDLMNEADFPSINIASGVEGDEVTEGIPDPYADQSPRIEVPELVYTQDPPYDTTVVEIGEKVRMFDSSLVFAVFGCSRFGSFRIVCAYVAWAVGILKGAEGLNRDALELSADADRKEARESEPGERKGRERGGTRHVLGCAFYVLLVGLFCCDVSESACANAGCSIVVCDVFWRGV